MVGALIIRQEVLLVMSQYGANFNIRDHNGNNLAHLALKSRVPKALEFLVNNTDIDVTTERNMDVG